MGCISILWCFWNKDYGMKPSQRLDEIQTSLDENLSGRKQGGRENGIFKWNIRRCQMWNNFLWKLWNVATVATQRFCRNVKWNSPPHICEANISQRSYFTWRGHISLAEGEFRWKKHCKAVLFSGGPSRTLNLKLRPSIKFFVQSWRNFLGKFCEFAKVRFWNSPSKF